MENKYNTSNIAIQQKEILKSFSKLLSAGYNLDKLLDHFLGLLQDLLKVSRLSILIQEDECFKVQSSRGLSNNITDQVSLPVNEGLVKHLINEGTAVRLDYIKLVDPFIVHQMRVLGGTAAVPVWEHGRLKAVIVFNNKIIGIPVTDEELELVFVLGSQLAVVMENATLVELMSEQRNYLENIIANVNSAIISIDNNNTVTTYNPKAEKILGISREEVIGKSINLLPRDIASLISETLKTGNPIFRREVKLSGLDKSVGTNITVIRDNQNNICGAVMIFTDLAHIKALEKQIRRTDRLEFINTVAMRSSHELKNCLVAIKTFAQLLPERYNDRQFREDFYLVVNREVDRLNQVVENLLFFAQPLKLCYSTCDVDEIIQGAIDSFEGDEILDGVSINKQFNHISSLIDLDRDTMIKVLRHLLYNSIQVMPQGGEIIIETSDVKEGGKTYLEISIVDSGMGITEDVSEKIWEPFFTTKTRGIGLGLTIVRKVVELHGGNVILENRSNSQGAKVTIRLKQVEQKKDNQKVFFPSGRAIVI